MHEFGLATNIYETCEQILRDEAAGQAGDDLQMERVKIAVGELAAVEPDLLAFAWEALTSEGPHQGSVLEIEWHPAKQVCPQCEAEKPRQPGDWMFACPDCGGRLRVEGGNELDILQITYQTEDESADKPTEEIKE